MLDIGFFELVVVGVVALLVIGPERLPETLRTLALWWGRLKRALQNTRAELEQQIGADDIRRQLHNEEIMQRLNATKDEIARAVNENVQDIQNNLSTSDSSSISDSPSNADNSLTATNADGSASTDKSTTDNTTELKPDVKKTAASSPDKPLP